MPPWYRPWRGFAKYRKENWNAAAQMLMARCDFGYEPSGQLLVLPYQPFPNRPVADLHSVFRCREMFRFIQPLTFRDRRGYGFRYPLGQTRTRNACSLGLPRVLGLKVLRGKDNDTARIAARQISGCGHPRCC